MHLIVPKKSFREALKEVSPQVKAALIGGIITVGLASIGGIWTAVATHSENRHLKDRVSIQDAKIQQLEVELTPFRTLALEKFSRSDPEALKSLATTMQGLQADYSNSVKTVSDLRIQLERVRETTAPRTLGESQRKELIRALSRYGTNNITIVTRMFDGESLDFGQQLGEVFREAKWDVAYNNTSLHDFRGITLALVGDSKKGNVIDSVFDSLKAAGINVTNGVLATNRIAGSLISEMAVVIGRK